MSIIAKPGRRALILGALALTALAAGPALAGELVQPAPVPVVAGVSQLMAFPQIFTLPNGGGAPLKVQANAFVSFGDRKGAEVKAAVTARKQVMGAALPTGELLAGPTIRAHPGDTLDILFTNGLPFDADEGDGTMFNAVPHGFDVLNLHTHGLHVSPQKDGDNVLLTIYPADTPADVMAMCVRDANGDASLCQKGDYHYRIKIPEQHPAGTYWYHPHKHGAVALQLASGMSGALIIQDEKNGIDSLPAVRGAAEKVMLLQSIESAPNLTSPQRVTCKSVYSFARCTYVDGQPAPEPAQNVNQKLSVNGQLNPTVTMTTDEVQLWRVVNTTVGTVVPMCLVPQTGVDAAAAPAAYVLAADGVPVQRPLSAGEEDLPLRLTAPVAKPDGKGVVNNELLFLAPGQRLDLMVKAPAKPGRYLLVQPAPGTVVKRQQSSQDPLARQPGIGDLCKPGVVPDAQLVMTVNVVVAAASGPTATALPTQSQLNRLYAPATLVDAADRPASPTQGVVFGFTSGTYAESAGGASVVNGRPFNAEGGPQRILTLGQTNLWGVMSAADTHMFHIHTNPFQVMKRGTVDYAFPIWRDTVLINCAPTVGGTNCTFPGGLTNVDANTGFNYGEVVQFLSQALDYTGAIVMHCHNTSHEDNGMMELVEMVEAGHAPTITPHAHHHEGAGQH
ncbi:multicopper oxidase family protein [Nitrospirillum viridazoti]|uniref:Copper oxidase n=1 Tax=Nitrospirillum viridazoti CBAmc TaxID=1441467 RepID=A0A248K1X7_9PROT|nr:multicopper oxidase domain-containing protein [Nitrospirillum amazonense]ASG24731.1 copper oxidase [Nitrospirillum amazonense CBAmc]TWB44956.1 FtsP/CotA-like multicopper oxidase with cupredoxin domain [Nitrospirillum amazonense]